MDGALLLLLSSCKNINSSICITIHLSMPGFSCFIREMDYAGFFFLTCVLLIKPSRRRGSIEPGVGKWVSYLNREKKLDTLVGHRPVAPVAPKGLYLYGNVGSGKLPDCCSCSKEALSNLVGSILSISFSSWPTNEG